MEMGPNHRSLWNSGVELRTCVGTGPVARVELAATARAPGSAAARDDWIPVLFKHLGTTLSP